MDFKQLRALITVAETGNVTRAAALLNTVQPALSRQLHLLEEDLGVSLFERGRGGMELTAAGRLMLNHARKILESIEEARADVAPSAGSLSGTVTIGLLASTADLLSAPLVARVAEQYPKVRLKLLTGYDGQLLEWLDRGDVDAALLYEKTPSPTSRVRKLLEVELWVVGPPNAGLSLERPVSLDVVVAQPFIFPVAPHGIRTLTEQAAEKAGLAFRIVAETNSVDVQKRLVSAGLGWTILSAAAVSNEIAQGVLSAAPLSDRSFVRRIVLVEGKGQGETLALQFVLASLVDCMRDAVRQNRWTGARWLE